MATVSNLLWNDDNSMKIIEEPQTTSSRNLHDFKDQSTPNK